MEEHCGRKCLDEDQKKVDEDVVVIEFEDYGKTCTLTIPDEPSLPFFVHSDASSLSTWTASINDFCETCGQDTNALLTQMATTFVETMSNMEGDEGYGEEGGYDDYGEYEYGEGEEYDPLVDFTTTKPEPKKEIDPVEQEIQRQRMDNLYLENIGSKGATMRLFDDLKNVRRGKPKDLGFSCQPVTVNGKMNLYEWEVRLFDFEGPLAEDMKEYQKKTGKNFVTLSMKFSADYPFKPPFIRVIEPRFKFRTGHVTLGGAICMELLTVTGWTANNDITSILIQVRAEIGSKDGGARLGGNHDQSSLTPYTEQEAWNAFYRAASTHGWKTEGLGANMFPKID